MVPWRRTQEKETEGLEYGCNWFCREFENLGDWKIVLWSLFLLFVGSVGSRREGPKAIQFPAVSNGRLFDSHILSDSVFFLVFVVWGMAK
jgi:hypothetical protein